MDTTINFLVYFSDIGLAAALIQKRDKIEKEDLRTTFTVQQILVVALLIVIFMASPHIRTFYNLDQSAIYLLYALGASFFMSIFRECFQLREDVGGASRFTSARPAKQVYKNQIVITPLSNGSR